MRFYRHITANHQKLTRRPFNREILMQAYLIENDAVLSLGEEEPYSEPRVLGDEIKVKNSKSPDKSGRIDLLVLYSDSTLAIVELKKNTLTNQHHDQLIGYLESHENRQLLLNKACEILDDVEKESLLSQPVNWLGILVGPSIEPELAVKISTRNDAHSIPESNFSIAAITLEKYISGMDVFVTSDIFFRKPSGKDFTKYIFNGSVYGKGKLVLAVIHDYISRNPYITHDELRAKFPWEVLGHKKLQLVNTLEFAQLVEEEYGYKRFYTGDEQVKKLSDGVNIVVCNQWGIKNINNFINHVQEFGYEIKEVK